ncbi:MAG TPA: imidazolonepropionase [Thermoplasmata archaeon]|nr:imidazolonepropionase [Thermoplasmata archaeon]
MITADLLVDDAEEIATLARGSIPRAGPAMRSLGLVRHAALAADRGRIVWIGPARRRPREVRLRPGGQRVSAEGGIVVPGFVDAHTHAIFAGDRAFELPLKIAGSSYAEIARRGGGLFATVRATRAAPDAEVLAETATRLRGMLARGSTTIEVKSGYALDVEGELRLLRLIRRLARRLPISLVPTFLGAHAVPERYRGGADAYLDRLVRDALPAIARGRLARFCDVFCEPGFFTVRQSERLLRAALAMGLGVKIHAEEFRLSGGARLAARLRATSADHLLAATADDRERLRDAGVTAVLLPVTAFAVGPARRSPGREFVDAGVPVALGTDCSPNSWVESMGVVLAHAVHGGRLTPAEALTAATVNAAHAVGEPERGRLVPGAPADFSIFPLRSTEQLGYRFDAVPAVVFRQGKRISLSELRQ